MPCGKGLWRSIFGAGDCGHRVEIYRCNTGSCGRQGNTSAGAKCTAAPPSKKTQEEEFYWKFSKKIQRKRHPTFKPPESSGFQIAARN
jgi:hypothetical protein